MFYSEMQYIQEQPVGLHWRFYACPRFLLNFIETNDMDQYLSVLFQLLHEAYQYHCTVCVCEVSHSLRELRLIHFVTTINQKVWSTSTYTVYKVNTQYGVHICPSASLHTALPKRADEYGWNLVKLYIKFHFCPHSLNTREVQI